ncbi:hypothetical protein TthHB5018_b22780 (plasmid) [Thermus thermophilus]|uniref:Arsenite oxidase subunit AioA/Iodate reductase subunit IdrA 3Fe-4S cluster domain-containing protein n=1 Tax=Thermus thermophilus TaxID=274 RepID=A0A7R7YJ57_THETH|nr:hypothetical protein TthHB5018_b22780 [Thermus thermophilus]
MALIPRRDRLPIPPKNAKVYNQVCQYCTVGCGYKVYVWPVGEEGGVKPEQNAFGLDLSTPQPPGRPELHGDHARRYRGQGRAAV